MNKNLLRYDYQNLEVRKHLQWIYKEYYPCFGWELVECISSEKGKAFVHLSFKREHSIRTRQELLRTQGRFDACIEEIRNLEISKEFTATVAAVIIGITGFLFMGFAGYYLWIGLKIGAFLIIPGIAGLTAAFPCYRVIKHEKEKSAETCLNKRYEELYTIASKAVSLLD